MPKSLKARLLRYLMLTLSIAWLLTLGVGYLVMQKVLNGQLDARLAQIAQSLSEVVTTTETTINVKEATPTPGRGTATVEFQIWRHDKMVSFSAHAPAEALSPAEGYSQTEVGQQRWRVFSARSPQSRVLVGEDLNVRAALIRGLVVSALWPMIIALPLIALILWLAVAVGLKPLATLAAAIKDRSPQQLTPLGLGDVPAEIVPVIDSFNALMGTVAKAFERERCFTDHAAHELRTPLAAIKTQAQLALRSVNEQEKNVGLAAVNQGIDRASKMVDQLLTLARLDPESVQVALSPVDLRQAVEQVISRYAPQALAKHIDLGLVGAEAVKIAGEGTFLELLIANLVDNAVRYSPRGSVVDVCVQNVGAAGVLLVEDHGPGIPLADRDRVFDRFVRLAGGETEGSGLGLAIVKRIVMLHHATIALDAPSGHPGLVVRVTFAQAAT